jgi:hypothetical protein
MLIYGGLALKHVIQDSIDFTDSVHERNVSYDEILPSRSSGRFSKSALGLPGPHF